MDDLTFEKLALESEDTLYRISMAILKNECDAQDVVHDAILLSYANLHKLRDEKFFKTWLVRILINQCKKELKKRSRYTDIGDLLPDISSRDNPYQSVEISEALDSLPPKLRLTAILFYVEDYSIKEISKALSIPEGTVKSRLNKGRKLLREWLED